MAKGKANRRTDNAPTGDPVQGTGPIASAVTSSASTDESTVDTLHKAMGKEPPSEEQVQAAKPRKKRSAKKQEEDAIAKVEEAMGRDPGVYLRGPRDEPAPKGEIEDDDDEDLEDDDDPIDDDDLDVDEDYDDDDQDEDEDDFDYGISESLIRIAVDAGIPEDEAREFDSEEDLERAVRIYMRSGGAKRAHPEAEVNGEQKQAPKFSFQDELMEFELDEDVDPGITKAIQGLNKRYHENTVALRDALIEVAQDLNQARIELKLRQFDDVLGSERADDFREQIGSGPSLSMSDRTITRRNRDAIWKEADVILAARTRAGNPISYDDAVLLAASRILDKKSPKQRKSERVRESKRAKRDARRELSERKKKMVARPSRKKGVKPPPTLSEIGDQMQEAEFDRQRRNARR